MGIFSPGSGTVGQTPQEQLLQQVISSQYERYQSAWLPVSDHLGQMVSDMAKPDSWQRQEAEGKAGADTAGIWADRNREQAVRDANMGVNPGSSRSKLGITGSAATEAQVKGLNIVHGNEAIDRAYTANLVAMTKQGQQLAAGATQGIGTAAEVGSREAISSAQEANAITSGNMGLAGFGIGVLGSPQGQKAISGLGSMFSSGGSGGGAAILDQQNAIADAASAMGGAAG